MDFMHLLKFVNLLVEGVLAGFEMGVHYGLGPPPAGVRDDAQILLPQTMVLRLRVLEPAIFVPALASAVALTASDRSNPEVWVALGAVATWIVFRVVRTVPVNSATITWNPNAPPENWRQLVDKTEKAHKAGSLGLVLAFVCLIAAALQ